MCSLSLELIVFSWPRVSGSTSGKNQGWRLVDPSTLGRKTLYELASLVHCYTALSFLYFRFKIPVMPLQIAPHTSALCSIISLEERKCRCTRTGTMLQCEYAFPILRHSVVMRMEGSHKSFQKARVGPVITLQLIFTQLLMAIWRSADVIKLWMVYFSQSYTQYLL